MIRFSIDGREVEVAPGQTILDGARLLGIDIPTLCHLERCGPMTSCLVCVVKITHNGRTNVLPSCAMKAAQGMVVESESPHVHQLRRSALELLLSDHVGDCFAPCSRICPLGLNIPLMLRQVQERQPARAIATLRAALALPAILGRLCHRPCENGCRRSQCDSAAAIGDVECFVADADQQAPQPHLPPRRTPTGHRIAIVGAGPTGIAAAYQLARLGHACTVFDRHPAAGGSLRACVESGQLPALTLERELLALQQFGIEFQTGYELRSPADLTDLQSRFHAVLLALGEQRPGTEPDLGVARTQAGLRIVNPDAFLTSLPAVFAAGSAIRPIRQLVKAMAEGQRAADAIHAFLSSPDHPARTKRFSSVMGRLAPTELALFHADSSPAPRQVPSPDHDGLFTLDQAATESGRCLHCDCRAEGHCRLQHYSQVYHAEFNRFSRQRRTFERAKHPAHVVFEPGKCILCGICVKIAQDAAEPLGLTFVGRGFEVRVAAPLNEAFDRGLQKVARECADACPTGAIECVDAHSQSIPSTVTHSAHPHGGCHGCSHHG